MGLICTLLFERLGILEAIKPKVIRPETDIVSELVAKGEIESRDGRHYANYDDAGC